MRLKKFVTLVLLFSFWFSHSQNKTVEVIHSDNTFVSEQYPGATISQGNVFIEHEGITLRCDKVYLYKETNLAKALGNVVINQGDTVFQNSKYADYDGNKLLATSWGNVVLKDQFMTLKTDTLYFDRQNQHLYYKSGGTIKDTTNFLQSQIGNYYLQEKKFQAFNEVDVINEDSHLTSERLDYYTNSGIADIYGPSTITSAENSIYTEKGHHNSKTKISQFLKNSIIYYEDSTVEGDSIYYDKNIEFASVTGNFKMVDTVNNLITQGGYAEYHKAKDSVFIIDNAVAISKVETDSIYIGGNKLMVTGPVEDRIVQAYHNVKIFKSDLQAKCDSLVSYEKTGLTKLLINPVMWAEESQITGDVIHLISNPQTEQLDSLKILDNAFMAQKDSAGYSQLKGKNMYGKFENNSLKTLDVVGNSEVLAYVRDEADVLIAITKMASSKNIFLTFKDNQISTIAYVEMPQGKTYPPSEFEELNEQQQTLKGLKWRGDERPLSKEDILVPQPSLVKTTTTPDKKEPPTEVKQVIKAVEQEEQH